MKTHASTHIALVVTLVLLADCAPTTRTDSHTAPSTPPSIQPTASPSSAALPPSPLPSQCLPLTGPPLPHAPQEHHDEAALLLDFLNRGGDPAALSNAISSWGQEGFLLPIVSDLDTDGIPEVILAGATHQPMGEAIGQVSVLRCVDGRYTLAATFDLGRTASVRVVALDDSNPAARPLLVLESPNLSWDTAFFAVLWDGQDWSIPLRHVSRAGNLLVSEGPSGFTELTISEPTNSCISCGPSRTSITVYGWVGDNLEMISSRLSPSVYRIQVLEDAQIALERSHLGEAAALYWVAATDRTLLDYPSDFELASGLEDTAGAYQTGFARFRYAVLRLLLEPGSSDMYSSEPEVAGPGSEFAQATHLIARLVSGGLDAGSACRQVMIQMAVEHPSLSGHRGHVGEWAGGSIAYDFDTICP